MSFSDGRGITIDLEIETIQEIEIDVHLEVKQFVLDVTLETTINNQNPRRSQ